MKIIALNGLLGYGYVAESLERCKAMDIDYIGVDAGSSDPGPHYLGNGTSFTDRNAVKRDVELALP
ncbi:MAG: 3-methylaspartate ammonia-lyase, partial [Desulforhabdus sp.]|nr:3-methylaspartate ammonia-lyase [Desulforhabdus sp.]